MATVTGIYNIVRHHLSAGPSWNSASVQVSPATVTQTQLENQRIDPQDLKGSPTTGNIRVLIEMLP